VTLKDLFSEFSFKQKALDRSVALAGLLTALLRGSLPTSPVCLIKGDGPGVGKSMLVDVIATVATGRLCPVITASRNAEETEKRIGAVLLSGSPIVSLDTNVHDLGGELLCQVTERPIVRIRILGRSEMPADVQGGRFDRELKRPCHTAVFATSKRTSSACLRCAAASRNVAGTGLVPGEDIGSVTWKRGVSDLIDTVRVRHASGGWSTIGLKSYEQGRGSFEDTAKDLIWFDEEPPGDVYIEALVRTMTTQGHVLLTFTPLEGMSEVVLMFLPGGALPPRDQAKAGNVLRRVGY
jgi:phage terminase large subunit-like protein